MANTEHNASQPSASPSISHAAQPSTWWRWALLGAIAAHAVILAACGGSDADAPQPPAAAAPLEASEAPEAPSSASATFAPEEHIGPRALKHARPDAAWLEAFGPQQAKTQAGAAAPHPLLGPRTWMWRPSSTARCGNGTSTGYAINHQPGSDTLLLYLQGGGACWGGTTCYGLKTSKGFLETKQEATVRAEVADPRMAVLFDREREGSLFAGMSHAYVPYCTGDLHAGTRAQTHRYLFKSRPAHHVGALNLDAFLADLVPLLGGDVKRVVLVGASAGGFGASMNWWRVREAFGAQVRVDVLNDSGPMIDPSLLTVWRDMREAWGLRTPPGCADCRDGPSKWLPFYARSIPGPERYAVIASEGDDVIGAYTLASDRAQARRLAAMRDAMSANQRAFLLPGDEHVQLVDDPNVSVDGVTLGGWVTQFLGQDPAWRHVGL
jgi:hypothetical protein